MTELELLRRYAEEGSQEAFAELVRRHLDLVHSAALRQVRSPQLAEEVAQSVFLDLARKAGGLRPDTQLGAWLYAVTRRTAVDMIRRESRRQARERAAAELATSSTPPWMRVEDLLDEAMASLRESDRQAVLLRYFQGRSLREVGGVLAISEDTAQKRISRAIGRLQDYFAAQGVAVSSAALTGGLSHHGVSAAPAALLAKIVAAAATKEVWSIAAYTASRSAAAAMLQKAAVAAATLALSAGLFETGAWALQARTMALERQRRGALETQASRMAAAQAAAADRLKATESEIDRQLADAQPGSDAALEARMNKWLGQISRLKATLVQQPVLNIPQLRYLTDRDWLEIASKADLSSDEGVHQALANLRNRAQGIFAQNLRTALFRYLQANGAMPGDPSQLAAFFDEPVPAEVLGQYAIRPSLSWRSASRSLRPSVIAIKAPVDIAYDQYWQIGREAMSIGSALDQDVTNARRQYAEANNGATTWDPNLLQPFLVWPADPAVIQTWLDKQTGHSLK